MASATKIPAPRIPVPQPQSPGRLVPHRPQWGWGTDWKQITVYLLRLVAGKSLLPCSPFHTSSCDSLNCQYLANRLEMNMSLHRWLSGRTHVCTSLPAPGSTRPGRRWSQDGGSRQRRPPAHLRFLVMRGRDAESERSLADLCGGPHLIQEALGRWVVRAPGKGG